VLLDKGKLFWRKLAFKGQQELVFLGVMAEWDGEGVVL
jgi:hypothetical protein